MGIDRQEAISRGISLARPRQGGDARIEVQVRGVDGIRLRLALLQRAEARRILRGAMRAGAVVLRDGARRRVPHVRGALQKSIRISLRQFSSGEVLARIKAGGFVMMGRGANRRELGAHQANIVEGGARAHAIFPRLKKALRLPSGGFAASVKHPGFAGRWFMRHTAEQDEARAVQAFRDYAERRFAAAWERG